MVVEFLASCGKLDRPRWWTSGPARAAWPSPAPSAQPSAPVLAIDLTPGPRLARKNAAKHGLADRVEFRQGDLLEPVAGEEPFDAILSNPPYIPTGVIPTLEPGVRDYEPHLALDGGADGLRVVARLIDQASPCSSRAAT